MILSHSECAKRYRLKKKLIARADNIQKPSTQCVEGFLFPK